eukprot:gene18821-887_t
MGELDEAVRVLQRWELCFDIAGKAAQTLATPTWLSPQELKGVFSRVRNTSDRCTQLLGFIREIEKEFPQREDDQKQMSRYLGLLGILQRAKFNIFDPRQINNWSAVALHLTKFLKVKDQVPSDEAVNMQPPLATSEVEQCQSEEARKNFLTSTKKHGAEVQRPVATENIRELQEANEILFQRVISLTTQLDDAHALINALRQQVHQSDLVATRKAKEVDE